MIAKTLKAIFALSALITSIEAIIRLAKMAWKLWLTFRQTLKVNPFAYKRKFQFGR